MEDIIVGKFEFQLFEADNYGVYRFNNENIDIIAVGNLIDIDFDSKYELHGEFVEHHKYGMQFKVNYYVKLLPETNEELLVFLSSSYFKGVGKVTASKIIKVLDNRPLTYILENPSILNDVKNLKKDIKDNIFSTLNTFEFTTQKIYELFLRANLSIDNVHLIAKKYGSDCYEKVCAHPYRLLQDFNVFNFKQIDKLAYIIGIDINDIERLSALLTYECMKESFKNGDSYILIDRLKAIYLKQNLNIDHLDEAFNLAIENKFLFIENDRVYHRSQFLAEVNIANYLNELIINDVEHIDYKDELKVLESNEGIEYSNEQIDAIDAFFNHSFSMIIGGPGTGKTTLIKALIKLHKEFLPLNSVVVLAPTGLAAKRISDLCDVKASTIHFLLKWNKKTNTFNHDENNPLYIDTVIIDESSMIDTYLFSKFINGVSGISRLCLIGDHNQLPSVAPGDVLHDLILSNKFMLTKLKRNYRQQKGSEIVDLAYDILNENIDFNKYSNEIKLVNASSERLKLFLVSSIKNYINEGYDFYEIQIMAPMYKGVLGIDNLNVYLQKAFNPENEGKKQIKHYQRIFRVGDKVLQIKNQSDKNVYNGDIGELIDIVYDEAIDKKHPQLVIDFGGNIVFYSYKEYDYITHAYAITVHKAQGSEYKITYIISNYEHRFMLQKELIYTAVSRTRDICHILGSSELFIEASTKKRNKRNTGLIEKIIKD